MSSARKIRLARKGQQNWLQVSQGGKIVQGVRQRRREETKAETSTDSVPPPCKADMQQQQQASLRRLITSADMKAEDVDQATPRTLTPGQRVATWS